MNKNSKVVNYELSLEIRFVSVKRNLYVAWVSRCILNLRVYVKKQTNRGENLEYIYLIQCSFDATFYSFFQLFGSIYNIND